MYVFLLQNKQDIIIIVNNLMAFSKLKPYVVPANIIISINWIGLYFIVYLFTL